MKPLKLILLIAFMAYFIAASGSVKSKSDSTYAESKKFLISIGVGLNTDLYYYTISKGPFVSGFDTIRDYSAAVGYTLNIEYMFHNRFSIEAGIEYSKKTSNTDIRVYFPRVKNAIVAGSGTQTKYRLKLMEATLGFNYLFLHADKLIASAGVGIVGAYQIDETSWFFTSTENEIFENKTRPPAFSFYGLRYNLAIKSDYYLTSRFALGLKAGFRSKPFNQSDKPKQGGFKRPQIIGTMNIAARIVWNL